jgi:hypothetical protein
MRDPLSPPARPLALTDSELDAVMRAARVLQPYQRDSFLKDIATELASLPVLGPGVVHRAIVAVQKKYFDAPDLRASVGKYD